MDLLLANRMPNVGPRQLAVVGVLHLLSIVFGSNTSNQCDSRRKRLGQFLSGARHAEGHLQVVGLGDQKPAGTRPAWNAEPRLAEEDS